MKKVQGNIYIYIVTLNIYVERTKIIFRAKKSDIKYEEND